MVTSFNNDYRSLLAGQLNCVRLVDSYITAIEKHKDLNAFVSVFKDEAVERGIVLDKKIATNKQGTAAGLIVSVKDNICYKGHVTTAASAILKQFRPPFTATALQRLIDRDAIVIGQVNCDELAMGSTNETSTWGAVHNPADMQRSPGGSSGGSAVSVAAGLCHVSLGSDTGGSIRQPASHCGVWGLKPTYGVVSRYGLLAYASSLDQISIAGTNADDLDIVLSIISGKDEHDATSYDAHFTPPPQKRPPKLAVWKDAFEHPCLHPDFKHSFDQLKSQLIDSGSVVEPVELPMLEILVPAYYIIASAEAASNLSRYDGVGYGQRSSGGYSFVSMQKNSRTHGFGTEVIRRILLGTFVQTAEYSSAYYTNALKIRAAWAKNLNEILSGYDCLILPVVPNPPGLLGAEKDPVEQYLEDVFTVPANLAGVPALSIPFCRVDGLPMGLQLIGPHLSDRCLLSIAQSLSSGCN